MNDARRSIDEDIAHGERALARVRRDIWPEYNGAMPDECTTEEFQRYVEELESTVAGHAAAMHMIGRTFTRTISPGDG